MMGSRAKLEEAKDKYLKAAYLFKMAKAWSAAGEAFERCADMNDQLDMPHEALSDRIQAAEMYKRVDSGKAMTLFKLVAQQSCEKQRFTRAAHMLENVGELLESESDLQGAVEVYQYAADYHFAENATARGAKMLEKIAHLYVQLGMYDRAAELFEKLGTDSLDSSLMKFGAKKHYMHAAFCLLARGDSVACKLAYDRFS